MKQSLREKARVPTSEDLDALIKEEDRALEQKYQCLLKKRQAIDEQITKTIIAMQEAQRMNEILKNLMADPEKQGR